VLCETPFSVAVKLTVLEEVTVEAVAVNPAVLDPAYTVACAGTVRELLLLESETAVVVFTGALRYTEHAFVVGPVND